MFVPNITLISADQRNSLNRAIDSRSTAEIAHSVTQIAPVRHAIVLALGSGFNQKPEYMRSTSATSENKPSITMRKKFEDLRGHAWSEQVDEMMSEFPEVMVMILNLMLNTRKGVEAVEIDRIMPRLGMIYSIMMNTRYRNFNSAQTVISCILMDNVVDSKVYDRLNAIGLSTSYDTMLNIMDRVEKKSDILVKEAIENGQFWRLIGDNLNYTEDVRDERRDIHKRMQHYFLSAVLTSRPISGFYQQRELQNMPQFPSVTNTLLIPTKEEVIQLIPEMLFPVAEVACKNLLFLSSFKDCLRGLLEKRNESVPKTKVYCMGALPFNESKYQDDVRILEYYQQKIDSWTDGAPPSDLKVPIGGDLLTAERLLHAKLLRLGNSGPEAFKNIGTVVFEFFHLQMKFLQKVTFKTLWKADAAAQGTMKTEAERISRKNVNPDDNNHYTQNKDYSDSFTKSMLLVGLQKFFGLDDLNSIPTLHCPPVSDDTEEKIAWLKSTLTQFVSEYALHGWLGNQTVPHVSVRSENVVVGQKTIQVTLKNGNVRTVNVNQVMNETVVKKPKKDSLKNYSHLTLELGLIRFALDSLCSNPDHDRMIILLKIIMMMLKSTHSQGKYAYYICRMLVQQLVILTEKEAHQLFYSSFVKTARTFVPADQCCEWMIGTGKRLIKHMGPNRSEALIEKRTKAMPSITEIAENFDHDSGVVQRFKVHGHRSAYDDELAMYEDLLSLDPFTFHPGRQLEGFNPPESVISLLNYVKYSAWLRKSSVEFITNFESDVNL